MLLKKKIKGIEGLDITIKKELVKKIIDNDFKVNMTHSVMFVSVEERKYALRDADVMELVASNIKKRLLLKRGISVKEFYKRNSTYRGYRLFDKSSRPEFQEGKLVEDKGKHGLYFTIECKDLFRILLASYFEDFGDSLAIISLISVDGKGTPVRKASISRGMDTTNTYHSRAFYIEKIYSLDNYELILKMYEAAPDNYKLLIYDETEGGMYMGSVKYYRKKGCNEIVRALNDIHQIEKKKRGFAK
ncbi:MAG: hypothetical protein II992_04355 [Lachnospiraceae bacterium]|nr:hypothetical protein [Lachnospiraceae bacterium]MBQ4530501.1 hypothetical protein [Lachnospiraceae bacterium]